MLKGASNRSTSQHARDGIHLREGWAGGKHRGRFTVLTCHHFPLSQELNSGERNRNRCPDSATPASPAPCGTTQSHKLPNEYSVHVNKAGQGCTIKQTTGSGLKVQRQQRSVLFSCFYTVDGNILKKLLVFLNIYLLK